MKRQLPVPKRYTLYIQSSHGRYAKVSGAAIESRSQSGARAAALHWLRTHKYDLAQGFAIIIPNDRPDSHPRFPGVVSGITERTFYVMPGAKPIPYRAS